MSTESPDSPEALAISARLVALVHAEISRAGGWIPFSRFMDLALYAPGLGYYSAGARKIGRHPGDGSDFVTAPELTPLFGRALARPVAELLASGVDSVLELGGGSGSLAADLLIELERLGRLPATYRLLEVSADLRERQAATLRERAPLLVDRVDWIDRLPSSIDGVVIGNEVLDALPVELLGWTGESWQVRGIVASEHGLTYGDRPVSAELLRAIERRVPQQSALPSGYLTEISIAAHALVGSLTERSTKTAVIFLFDYGFPASEYYHPQRSTGTLVAHRRHRASSDLLAHPGLQDITAHVDFSAVADAAQAAGGLVVGFTNQASFLIDCGIADLLVGGAEDPANWAPQASALQMLLSEAEMGESFKVIAIARVERPLTGFGGRDRRERL